MILHFSQIGLTDDLTFTAILLSFMRPFHLNARHLFSRRLHEKELAEYTRSVFYHKTSAVPVDITQRISTKSPQHYITDYI